MAARIIFAVTIFSFCISEFSDMYSNVCPCLDSPDTEATDTKAAGTEHQATEARQDESKPGENAAKDVANEQVIEAQRQQVIDEIMQIQRQLGGAISGHIDDQNHLENVFRDELSKLSQQAEGQNQVTPSLPIRKPSPGSSVVPQAAANILPHQAKKIPDYNPPLNNTFQQQGNDYRPNNQPANQYGQSNSLMQTNPPANTFSPNNNSFARSQSTFNPKPNFGIDPNVAVSLQNAAITLEIKAAELERHRQYKEADAFRADAGKIREVYRRLMK
jgi:hypothetical protein